MNLTRWHSVFYPIVFSLILIGCDNFQSDPLDRIEQTAITNISSICQSGTPFLQVDLLIHGFLPIDIIPQDDPVGLTNLWVDHGGKENTWAISYQVSVKEGARQDGRSYPYVLFRAIGKDHELSIPEWEAGDRVEVEYFSLEGDSLRLNYQILDIPVCS